MVHPGEHVGPNRIVRFVGEGPFGSVWEAVSADGARIAMKLLRPGFFQRPEGKAAFERLSTSIQVHSRISHPNLAIVYESIRVPEAEAYGLTMEFLDGQSLSEARLPANARRGENDRAVAGLLSWFEDIGAVVHWLHTQRIVHGNLKPSNVMVLRDVNQAHLIKLLDLSWAAIGVAAPPEGADWSLAPEQLAGSPPTQASDQWAVASMLARILSGGKATMKLGTLPGFLVMSVQRAMHEDPEQRFPSVGEFVRSLTAVREQIENSDGTQRLTAGPTLRMGGSLAELPEFPEPPQDNLSRGYLTPRVEQAQVPKLPQMFGARPLIGSDQGIEELKLLGASDAESTGIHLGQQDSPAPPRATSRPPLRATSQPPVRVQPPPTASSSWSHASTVPPVAAEGTGDLSRRRSMLPYAVGLAVLLMALGIVGTAMYFNEPRSHEVDTSLAAATPDTGPVAIEPPPPKRVDPPPPPAKRVDPPPPPKRVVPPPPKRVVPPPPKRVAPPPPKRVDPPPAPKRVDPPPPPKRVDPPPPKRVDPPASPEARQAALADACDEGKAQACFGYAGLLKQTLGDGVQVRAAYERSCNLGLATACIRVGDLFYAEKKPLSFGRALSLYEKACQKKSATGCHKAAGLWAKGQGAAKDETRAKRFEEKACELGRTASCAAQSPDPAEKPKSG